MHRETQYTPHLMTPSRVKDGFGRKGTGMDQHDIIVKLAFDYSEVGLSLCLPIVRSQHTLVCLEMLAIKRQYRSVTLGCYVYSPAILLLHSDGLTCVKVAEDMLVIANVAIVSVLVLFRLNLTSFAVFLARVLVAVVISLVALTIDVLVAVDVLAAVVDVAVLAFSVVVGGAVIALGIFTVVVFQSKGRYRGYASEAPVVAKSAWTNTPRCYISALRPAGNVVCAPHTWKLQHVAAVEVLCNQQGRQIVDWVRRLQSW